MPTRTSASLSSLEDSRFLLQEQRIRVRSACARTAEALRQHEAAEAFEAQHRSLVNRLDNVIDSDNDAVEDLLVNYERRLQVAQVRAEEARENDQDLRQSELRQLRVRDEQAAEKAAYAMEQEKDGQKSRLRASQRRVADTKERFAELTRDEWQRERAFLHSYNYKRKTILERFNTADEAKQLSQLDKELKFHLFDVHLKTEGIKFQQSAALEKILAARMVEEEASTARQAAIEAQAGKKRAALKEERRLSAVRAKLRCIALQEKAEHSIRLIQQDHESAVASLTYKIHQANLKRKRQFDILEADRIQGQETRLQREAKIAAVEKSALEELAQARSRQTQKAHHRRHSEPPPHSESTSESRKRQKNYSMPSEKTRKQSYSSSPPPTVPKRGRERHIRTGRPKRTVGQHKST
ncbi:hypothetical protein BKA62DRAFT_832269 [Auriculariales sp. MPI-PUGE-AT-0066]|nr:hypothetical protein BKA62DRAFT_832269 [Auriculariales sp. MPI-PUGE-AT-0066]